ncbi:MAG: bifunctional diaminohydroxyphosphoribosylaminopyrimidine deaminase/5-amino-6-(5-phosphoribosylamino)uracil reductase RibD [Betaproteobacteria bacterium]|nr:bifunctional diaminohydroxyphosphoribosylaminopyrimidine deaminase/5-amino-6-(5-phosphoribosylamino)uracil reductase RibD [Betaproteobacteria bacterium]
MSTSTAAPPNLPPLDFQRLTEALALAEQATGLSDPNPRVGCIVGLADGTVLGRGSTQAAGQAHAEVMALRDAAAAGRSVRGATAWVTLEPCAHHGRTPPCCDALVAAGIARVVVAIADPFAKVDGRGLERLRAAGVEVVAADPASDIATAAHEINIGFFSRVRRSRPWLRMKIAASLDGRTALANGRSQWITGPAARADGHAWRRRAAATLTGIGTVLEDDPRLDVRDVPTARQPQRVIVDSRLQTPPAARILQPPGTVWIYAAAATDGDAQAAARRAALEATGAVEIHVVGPHSESAGDAAPKVDLAAMLTDLAARGINELHVEAGHKLNASLLRAGLVDELLVYLAPKFIGLGREMAAFGPITELTEALQFRFIEATPIGDDLRIRARPPGRERF